MKSDKINITILFLIPFLYLFPHSLHLIEMGNDFELLYFSYKKYIFEFIQVGHFPLWSPSEGAGYSLVFNPFAQYFYPLSWILYFFSYLIGDLSKYGYLLYTILGISIYNTGQYLWLRKLNINIKHCFFATLITCFGLKLNELLRFPNAIHAFAWFSWILYGMTLSINSKNKIKSFSILFISTILILTAGYPYYILYGLILFGSYFIFIAFNVVKIEIYKSSPIQNNWKLFLNNVLPPILALLIVSPWFKGIMELMEITRDRNLQDISFSFTLSSNLIDQLGSWILPPISMAEGYYYFGAIITLLLIFYIINFSFERYKKKFEKFFLIFFIFFFVLNYQFAAAENSYLFQAIWNKYDFIKNFRAFARINILLIPLFSVLFCFMFRAITEKKNNINFILTISFTGILIIFLQIYIIEFSDIKNIYWENWQQRRLLYASNRIHILSNLFNLYNNYIYSLFFIFSIILVTIIKKIGIEKFFPYIIVIFVASELFILSNLQWAIPLKYYDSNNYNLLNKTPLKTIKDSFMSERIVTELKGNEYFRNLRKFNINYVDQLGMDQHSKLVDKYFNRNGTIKENLTKENIEKIIFFWGLANDNKVFFTTHIDYLTIEKFVDDVKETQKNNNTEIFIDINAYNGDEIIIKLDIKNDGYITFVDNWSPGWKVYTNNVEKNIIKTLGAYKGVQVNSKTKQIKFKYEPW